MRINLFSCRLISCYSIAAGYCRAGHGDCLWWWCLAFSPVRGFHVGRRGICCLVPIIGGRRLAWLVRLGGGACPSRGCQVDRAVQFVDPAPTPHDALGGRWAFAGYGPATDAFSSAHPSEGRTRAWWHPRDRISRWCDVAAGSWSHWALTALLALASTPRCRASGSSKHSLRRGSLSDRVSDCRATGIRDYVTARRRWSCDGACPLRRLRRWWNGTRCSRTGRPTRATRLPWPLVEAKQQMPSSSLVWRLCQRAGPVGRQGCLYRYNAD